MVPKKAIGIFVLISHVRHRRPWRWLKILCEFENHNAAVEYAKGIRYVTDIGGGTANPVDGCREGDLEVYDVWVGERFFV